jgi:hypothetical protein
MAGKFKVRSGALGSREEMPKLDIDELGYRTDEKALYIGTEAKNERLCGVEDIPNINDRLNRVEADIVRELNQVDANIASIIARLDALEKPSE